MLLPLLPPTSERSSRRALSLTFGQTAVTTKEGHFGGSAEHLKSRSSRSSVSDGYTVLLSQLSYFIAFKFITTVDSISEPSIFIFPIYVLETTFIGIPLFGVCTMPFLFGSKTYPS